MKSAVPQKVLKEVFEKFKKPLDKRVRNVVQ